MKAIARLLPLLLLALTITIDAQNIENATVNRTDASRGVGAAIQAIGSAQPTWFAWTVPTGGQSICCNYRNGASGSGCCGRCTIDGNAGFSINRNDEDGGPIVHESMLVVVRVEQGKARRVRTFSASCTLDGQGKTVHLLTNVAVDSSIDYLLSQLHNTDRDGETISVLSFHEHPRVVPALIDLARHDPNSAIRRDAIFWLGQKAGDKVAGELRHAIDNDPDTDVKTHAVFAISQLPRARSVPLLIDLVKTHKNRTVREKAMFWLAQTNDPRAIDLMESILLK